MTKNEWKEIFDKLCIVYGRDNDAATMIAYFEYLEKYELQRVKDALNYIATHSKFFPKLAEITTEIEYQAVESTGNEVIDKLVKEHRFKNVEEKQYCIDMIKAGIIPYWLQKEIEERRLTIDDVDKEFDSLKEELGIDEDIQSVTSFDELFDKYRKENKEC